MSDSSVFGWAASEEAARGEGRDSKEMIIDHLKTMLQAELENSNRITRKIELVSGAIIALLGLGFLVFNGPIKGHQAAF